MIYFYFSLFYTTIKSKIITELNKSTIFFGSSVYPKVIDAPIDGKLSAVAKDGIEVRASCGHSYEKSEADQLWVSLIESSPHRES